MDVVITGASRGIGKAIAQKFAASNHNLILCARNEGELYQTMHGLLSRHSGISVKALPADISDPKEATRFGRWASEAAGQAASQPCVLVNNAGQFLPGSLHNEPPGTLEKMMAVNLYSAYHVTRALLPLMMQHRKGHIFNMCSVASLGAYKNGGAYSISKYALLGFSANLREEMKPYGIKVTSVMPGAVYTDSWSGSGIPHERIMEADDIATLVFAASQLSAQAVVEDIVVRPQLGDL